MAAVQQALIRRPWTVEDARAFAPSVDANPWPLENLQNVLTGAHQWEYIGAASGAHARIAVRPVDLAVGRRLDVVGLVSDAGRLTGEDIRRVCLEMAYEMRCDMLAMCTQRPHLARACVRAGWKETGTVLTMDARNLQ